jgi:cell division protein FtsB
MAKRQQTVVKGILIFLLFVAVIALTAMIVVLILPSKSRYLTMEQQLRELEREMSEKSAECIRLQQIVRKLQTDPQTVEKVAREKFHLVREGETIYTYDPAVRADTELSRTDK